VNHIKSHAVGWGPLSNGSPIDQTCTRTHTYITTDAETDTTALSSCNLSPPRRHMHQISTQKNTLVRQSGPVVCQCSVQKQPHCCCGCSVQNNHHQSRKQHAECTTSCEHNMTARGEQQPKNHQPHVHPNTLHLTQLHARTFTYTPVLATHCTPARKHTHTRKPLAATQHSTDCQQSYTSPATKHALPLLTHTQWHDWLPGPQVPCHQSHT
jgi:hypothetical protein